MGKKWLLSLLSVVLITICLIIAFYMGAQSTDRTLKKVNSHEKHRNDKDVKDEKSDFKHTSNVDHDNENSVLLNQDEIVEFGIEVSEAGPGKIKSYVSLPGEVGLNEDRLAHIVPRVSGIARDIRKNLGDQVRKDELMAELESRELADTKADYLASRERLALTQKNFIREERLWRENISAEQEYLEAKQAFAEAKIELRAAEQKLHALGFSEEFLKQLPTHSEMSLTRYNMVAPFDGTVIEKHITLGEMIKDDITAYVVADLSSVWVNINVYQKDLLFIKKGLSVDISAAHGFPVAKGILSYVGPLIGEKTRTALARVVLPNVKELWRPGQFITASISVDTFEAPIMVPKTAIQNIDERAHIFIETEGGFAPTSVTIGRTNSKYAEITSGLSLGQRYVTKGAFTLKAQLSKTTFGGGHGH